MKKLKRALIVITSIIALFLFIPTITLGILHYWILTPEYLTSAAKQAIDEYTYLKFNCKSIELDYLSSWPSVSLSINEGNIVLPNQKDSTFTNGNITFQKMHGNIQLKELLVNKRLQIENIFLQQPQIVLSLGKQNPLFLKKRKSHTSNSKIRFHIDQIDLNNADINISIPSKEQNFHIQNTSLSIKGNLFEENSSFTLETVCKHIGGSTIDKFLGNTISFSLHGKCQATKNFNDIKIVNTSFKINQFPFQLKGNISNLLKKEEANVDLTFNLLTSKLKDILDFIPEQHFTQKSQYSLTGNTSLKGTIKGGITKANLPNIKLNCQIDNGSFYKKGINKGIDTISFNLSMSYLPNIPDSCYINLSNSKIKGLNSFIEVQSHITNLEQSPFITADLKGFIDFDYIGKEFISPDIAQLNGKIESDLSIAFNLKDLKEENLNRIWISGIFKAPHVKAKSPQHNLDVFIANTEASIGYKKNKSDFIKDAEILNAEINIDTLKMQYDKYAFLNISKLNLRTNTSLSKNIKTSSSLTTRINCKELQAQLNSNHWINAQSLTLFAGTKSLSFKNKSEAACVIQADEIQYLDNKEQNAIALNNSNFILELHPNANNKWDIKGLLNFHESQIYTSYFPIDIKAQQARVSFNNDQISINHVQMNVGESDCILSGIFTVSENPKAKIPLIEGTVNLLGEYINYNELKKTLLYTEAAKKEFHISNLQNFQISELNHIIREVKNNTTEPEPIIIPENLHLGIDLSIKNMSYEEIDLHQINGHILIKDMTAYTSLSTNTNLGKINLTALYESENKDKIQAKCDLILQDVLIALIHNTIPTIGTLFPMVESMSGLINCHLTLSCQLDNQMLPILPTTVAVCTIEGKNLTLFDHDVFRNIAKKFMLKNKEKNIIDHLSANLILENNQIEVIPFQIKWDRYEAIVGGTHTTDFTYNYHISLLKAPILPWDQGLNLFGQSNNMDYKLSKCKYKHLFKDDGKEHEKKTKERLKQKREEITKHITL